MRSVTDERNSSRLATSIDGGATITGASWPERDHNKGSNKPPDKHFRRSSDGLDAAVLITSEAHIFNQDAQIKGATMTTTTIDDFVNPGTVISAAGETQLTSLMFLVPGLHVHPGYDANVKVNSGYLQLSDNNGIFVAYDSANGYPGKKNIIGQPITFAGQLVVDSVLTGGSVQVTTA